MSYNDNSIKSESRVFREGQRVKGTMLTVISQAEPGSWAMILCRCDCGNEVELPYQVVYYRRYSCGCRKRPRQDAVDYSFVRVESRYGNRNAGRSLIVLDRDAVTGQWTYVCECCARLFTVPRGMERGLLNSMKRLASEECPGYRQFTATEHIVRLTNELVTLGFNIPGEWKTDVALNLAPYYRKKYIKYNGKGEIAGFYGLPDLAWLPRVWRTAAAPPTSASEGLREE